MGTGLLKAGLGATAGIEGPGEGDGREEVAVEGEPADERAAPLIEDEARAPTPIDGGGGPGEAVEREGLAVLAVVALPPAAASTAFLTRKWWPSKLASWTGSISQSVVLLGSSAGRTNLTKPR